MRHFYTAAYWLGFRPWEQMATLPVSRQISELFECEERDRNGSPGQALDLGCGTGFWAVRLAARGWQVTGIDFVGNALRKARTRVHDANLSVRLIRGDVTALRAAGVGTGFEFVLDLGALHGFTNEQRHQAGREITAVTAPGATLLMLAWMPARRPPMFPRGVKRKDVEAAFPDWTVIGEVACDVTGAPRLVRRAAPRFLRLRASERAASTLTNG